MTGELGLCEARIHAIRADGTDLCRRNAKHEHYSIATGTRLKLCTQHLAALERRERLGSSRDLIDAWNQRGVL